MHSSSLHNTQDDIKYMRRCLQLAANGLGRTSPNPMVGAVIVSGGRIIGEGWHHKAGEPHAEPNAIASVHDPSMLRHSTLYVNLEPCAHYGKTPPCAEKIIRCGIPRVVVGCPDPFPQVSGKGVRMMREAGIEVVCGVEEEACRQLNRRFFRFHLSKRPYIVLKWASTADGFTDSFRPEYSDGEDIIEQPLRISDTFCTLLAHRLRSQCDAVLVGSRTALQDHPSLSVRHWPLLRSQEPARYCLDRHGKAVLTLQAQGIEPLNCPDLPSLMDFLYQKQIQSLLVEGGSTLQNILIQQDLWDEIHVEQSPLRIGDGHPAPRFTWEDHPGIHFQFHTTGNGHRIDSAFRLLESC